MICIYCGGKTKVINSRMQKRPNQVWRRRQCLACGAVFTTREGVDTLQAIRMYRGGHLGPFSRDNLLVSIYDSLKHRKTAIEDATALTETVLAHLYPLITDATLDRTDVVEITTEVLERFDKTAAVHYRAFHP